MLSALRISGPKTTRRNNIGTNKLRSLTFQRLAERYCFSADLDFEFATFNGPFIGLGVESSPHEQRASGASVYAISLSTSDCNSVNALAADQAILDAFCSFGFLMAYPVGDNFGQGHHGQRFTLQFDFDAYDVETSTAVDGQSGNDVLNYMAQNNTPELQVANTNESDWNDPVTVLPRAIPALETQTETQNNLNTSSNAIVPRQQGLVLQPAFLPTKAEIVTGEPSKSRIGHSKSTDRPTWFVSHQIPTVESAERPDNAANLRTQVARMQRAQMTIAKARSVEIVAETAAVTASVVEPKVSASQPQVESLAKTVATVARGTESFESKARLLRSSASMRDNARRTQNVVANLTDTYFATFSQIDETIANKESEQTMIEVESKLPSPKLAAVLRQQIPLAVLVTLGVVFRRRHRPLKLEVTEVGDCCAEPLRSAKQSWPFSKATRSCCKANQG